jgi:rhamnopyranosyl-N-acetylglucosaminyl-diphospho-decaprenol beta-1,3/1,4-galactofuranosyltransferase
LLKNLLSIDFSSFVGCFLRTEVVRNQLGLPRKELFIYADDIMYTHGIGQCGLAHTFAPEVKFVHECATLQQQLDVYKPMWKVYYTYRNRVELFRQVAWNWVFYPIAVFKLFAWLAKFRYYEDRWVYFRLTMRAWWDGIRRNFKSTHEEVMLMAKSYKK